mmetsp:Transcript_77898/g.252564  ORF Transcript_77898/g.252564 Transcript_77898/m.252564 type:complete len:275 (-) Transcript_77898:2062-2886(-)
MLQQLGATISMVSMSSVSRSRKRAAASIWLPWKTPSSSMREAGKAERVNLCRGARDKRNLGCNCKVTPAPKRCAITSSAAATRGASSASGSTMPRTCNQGGCVEVIAAVRIVTAAGEFDNACDHDGASVPVEKELLEQPWRSKALAACKGTGKGKSSNRPPQYNAAPESDPTTKDSLPSAESTCRDDASDALVAVAQTAEASSNRSCIALKPSAAREVKSCRAASSAMQARCGKSELMANRTDEGPPERSQMTIGYSHAMSFADCKNNVTAESP